MTSGRWSSYRPESSGRFVDKEVWARDGIVFTVSKIEESNSNDRFGEQWLLTVQPDEGEEKILSFSKGSGSRDEAIEGALNDLEAGNVQTIGPLVLVKVRTKSGRPFFTIEDAEDEAAFDQAFANDTTKPQTRLPNQVDDELPF